MKKKITIQYKKGTLARIIKIYIYNILKTSQLSYLLIK